MRKGPAALFGVGDGAHAGAGPFEPVLEEEVAPLVVAALFRATTGARLAPCTVRALHARLAASIVAVAVLTASCGSSSGSPPFGLDSISLPERSSEIAAVLAEMPDTLRGLPVSGRVENPTEVRLSYGPQGELAIGVIDFGSGAGDFPPRSAGEMLSGLAESGEIDIEESDLEGELVWFTGTNHSLNEQGEVLETYWQTWFGARSSGWVFAVSAPSEEDGIAFVEAFVEAAS